MNNQTIEAPLAKAFGVGTIFYWLAALLAGGLVAWLCSPMLSPIFAQSLLGAEAKGYWDISRATGVVAYVLFWLSMMMGLLMSTRTTRLWSGTQSFLALHEFCSISGLVFAAVHALILMGDGFLKTDWLHILTPFAMNFKQANQSMWVGLGQLGFYLLGVILLSFYVRSKIGFGMWRWLHFGTFIAFMLVTVHGMLAGTDSNSSFMLGVYLLTTGSMMFLTLYRILLMRAQKT